MPQQSLAGQTGQHRRKRFIAALPAILMAAATTAMAIEPASVRIDADVTSVLAKGGRPEVIVRFRDRADLSPAFDMDRTRRGRFVHDTLMAQADRSQASIRQALERRHGRGRHDRGYTVLWIDNAIAIPDLDEAILATLAAAPDVESVRESKTVPPPTPPAAPDDGSPLAPRGSVVGNLAHIKVPEVWALGYDGDGIIVGNIDTGVRHSHQALVNQYRGRIGDGTFQHAYNWYDPYHHSPVPRSSNPHGSHTVGTSVGDDGGDHHIGVAPGARWIACIGLGAGSGSGGTEAGLIEYGQWMLAPTGLDGNEPDPDLRADVVNNSWGGCERSYNDWYDGVIDAWVAAGIVPVFANGNASACGYPRPPGLNSVSNPARSGKVLGVGSTGTDDGQYADHSNWGPTDNANPGPPSHPDPRGFADLKPNVVAPGVGVLSAGDQADDHYYENGGTSMSAPHVSGLVALMWQAAPCLRGDYASTGTLIMETANPVPYATGSPSDGPGNVPNQATGWGEIDALAAVEGALDHCGPQGWIAGTVSAADSGQPIAGAALEFTGANDYLLVTGDDGDYHRMMRAGDYMIDIQAFGHLPATVPATVIEDETVALDIVLEPGPRHDVAGTVIDEATGWPLYARIHIVQPGGSTQVWSDPLTGAFQIALPAGADYTLTASAVAHGYLPESVELPELAADTSVDLMLTADVIACTAPGYSGGGNVIEDFEAGDLPPGWNRETDRPGNQGWQIGEDLGSTHFTIPSHTFYAASNDDSHGPASVARRERLITPPLDFPAEGKPTMQYASAFSGGHGQLAMVEISADDGGTWTTIATPTPQGSAGEPQWREQHVDLSGYAGQTVRIAFRTDDGGGWASGWAIDDVLIRSGLPCEVPTAGGLLLGRVRDSDTAPEGLNDAVVTVDGGNATTSAATGDPAIGDGYYQLFVPAGMATVTVDLPPYPVLERTVQVPDLGVRRIDFDFADPDAGDIVFRDGFEGGAPP